MLHTLIIAAGALALLAATADAAWAAGLPTVPFSRGPGWYLSLFKILAAWLVFLAWVYSTDWLSRDAIEHKLQYLRWNPLVFGTFLAAFILVWLIPWFWLSFPLLLAAYGGPLGWYVVYRNARVEPNQQVLTPDHIRWWLSQRLKKIGIKIVAESRDPNVGGAPVKLFSRGGADAQADSMRMLAARESPGLPVAREIVAEGLASRASAIMLDYTTSTVAVRHMVDGVWLPRPARERETADPALQALKLLCGLNAQSRQGRQEGPFGVEYWVLKHAVFDKVEREREKFKELTSAELTKKFSADELPAAQLQQKVARALEEKLRETFASPVGPWTPVDKEAMPKLPIIGAPNPHTSCDLLKCNATLTCQGSQAAERVLVQFEVKPMRLESLNEIGLRDKLQEQLKELLEQKKGFVLLSAIPSGGLRTTTGVVLHSMDRFTREFAAVEDEANRYREVENVPVTTYKSAEGQDATAVLPKLFRGEPHVIVIRDLDAPTVSAICSELTTDERLFISTIRAKDCAEALLRVLALGVPAKEFAPQVTGVLCQRLIRKLCDKCKEGYAPSPEVLKQLGIPEGRVRALYRPRTVKAGDDKQDICIECGGIGYKGVTGIFELLLVDDMVRMVLTTSPKLDLLRKAARKAGMKSLQEEGVLLVARGATSLAELQRVLKQ